jgi:hypothetical protein
VTFGAEAMVERALRDQAIVMKYGQKSVGPRWPATGACGVERAERV